MSLMGEDFNTALFVGAALTATSVGITARVFGDLRALATHEARVVLGAAVADDVMGLVVLTVVVRLVTEGSVSALSVLGIIAVAVLFLVLGSIVGLRVAPPLFAPSTACRARPARSSRWRWRSRWRSPSWPTWPSWRRSSVPSSPGSRCQQGEQASGSGASSRRSVTSSSRCSSCRSASTSTSRPSGAVRCSRDAGVLLVVAVVGKLLSPLGAIGAPGDKPLIGLGMLPRGEVGLIFATIGLQNGVLGDDLYAALLLVVLVTTLVTPPLLKVRYQRLRADSRPSARPARHAAARRGVAAGRAATRWTSRARPPDGLAVPLAFDAAIPLARRRPVRGLLDWLAEAEPDNVRLRPRSSPPSSSTSSSAATRARGGSSRPLGCSTPRLPELADAPPPPGGRRDLARRLPRAPAAGDASGSAPAGRDDPLAIEVRALEHVDRLLLAAFLIE